MLTRSDPVYRALFLIAAAQGPSRLRVPNWTAQDGYSEVPEHRHSSPKFTPALVTRRKADQCVVTADSGNSKRDEYHTEWILGRAIRSATKIRAPP